MIFSRDDRRSRWPWIVVGETLAPRAKISSRPRPVRRESVSARIARACSSVSRTLGRRPSISVVRGSAISSISGIMSPTGQSRPTSRSRASAGSFDERMMCDHLVDVGHGDGQADQDVAAVARLGELELGAADHDVFAEVHEGGDHVAQAHQLGPAVVQRQRVDRERRSAAA